MNTVLPEIYRSLINAGSNTAADRIDVLGQAISQIPAAHRCDVLIRSDGAGASHDLIVDF